MEKNYEILNIDETPYKTQVSSEFKNRKNWELPDITKLYSFIPGTINEIFVEIGDEVEEGQDLLILEAMKMMNRVKSPVTGKVKGIYVRSGAIIPKKHLIMEFE